MKIIKTLFIVLFCSSLAQSQTLTVVEKTSQQALPGVIVSSKKLKHIAVTDENGQLDITAFRTSDSIVFLLNGYNAATVSTKDLIENKYLVEMTLDVLAIKEVTVSNKRWEENSNETPNRIERIGMKDVAFQNPQTTADLLGTSGYVFVQKSQMGGGSPMLRGMATNRVLLVVDGVRMNTAIFRSGNVQNVISLDANAIQNTEILFGPGSLMYGSDAIGGVMDFQMLIPKFSNMKTKKPVVTGNAMMRTSTANSEKTGHLDINVGLKKWAFVTSFTRADYGDLRSGSVGGNNYFYRKSYVQTIDNKDYMVPNEDSTLQVGSKYDQTNFMQKAVFKPSSNWEFDYGFHLSQTSSFNRYDRLYVMQTSGPYKNKLRWAEWYYGPQKWNMHRIGMTHSKKTLFYDHLRLVTALQHFEESRFDREFMVRELRMQKETVRAASLNLDLDKKLSNKLTLYYGLEAIHNLVNSYADLTHVVTGKVTSTVTRYPNGSTWESYGMYGNLRCKLTDKLNLNGGLRYSYYRIKAEFDTTFFPFPFTSTEMKNGTLNGSLGFFFEASKSWQMYANGATGFRAPNIDDMGKVFESTPGFLVVPNPTLKPEKVYNAEIGLVKTFGSFLKFDCAGYYTWLRDAMVRKDYVFNGLTQINFLGNPSKIQAMQNVAKIRVYGFQAGVEVFYKGFGLKSTFSYQNGKEQSADSLIYYPLRHAAPMFGSTHLTYTHKVVKFDFYAVYNGKMDYEDLSLTERLNLSYARDVNGLPYSAAWYTLNFKVAYYVNQYVSMTAGVENIMDILYRPYSSGINASGRNFIASLRARF